MGWRNLLGLAITWVVVVAFFVCYIGLTLDWEHGRAFASLENLETVLRQTSIVAYGAIGMTFVIVSGMIDLSAGSVVAFVTIFSAWILKERNLSPAIAGLGGLAAGALCGFVNGTLITRLRISAFIVTLGTLLAFRGCAKWMGNNEGIYPADNWLFNLLPKLAPEQRWMIAPIGVWMLVVLALVANFVLERTVFGRNVVAVGANEEAARLAGIPPEKVRRTVFLIAGLCLAFAGIMQFSRIRMGDPSVAQGLELDIIAAVVIGGASLSGGQGSIAGSLLGALVIATLRAGASQAGFQNYVQEIVTGAILIGALALDRIRQERRAATG